MTFPTYLQALSTSFLNEQMNYAGTWDRQQKAIAA